MSYTDYLILIELVIALINVIASDVRTQKDIRARKLERFVSVPYNVLLNSYF